ncbi:MAG: hypothetical protein RLZZ628_2790 [Bacteroidota bacterium]|jgi:hypothetical protein
MNKNSEEIIVKCRLCTKVHEYKCPDNQLIALAAEWKYRFNNKNLLSVKPLIGKSYEIFLKDPLKINLATPFWVLYMDPFSQINGIETEADIESLRFCLCKKTKIVEKQDFYIRLQIVVINFNDLDMPTTFTEPSIHYNCLFDEITDNHIEYFNLYNLININIQGDLGLTAILKKTQHENKIVAVHEWDFHTNLWYRYEKNVQIGIKNESK